MEKLLITDYDIEGRGITRIDNVVTFVSNALVLEEVAIKITKKNKTFNEGVVIEIFKKSNNRIVVKCPYYFDCGGCNLMHMNYEEELKFKANKVKNTLSKFLGCEIKTKLIIAADEILNYRNKVKFQVKNEIGFFEQKSNKFLKIDECLICDDKINRLIPEIKSLNLATVKNIVVRSSKNTDDVMVIIETDKDINVNPITQASSVYLKMNNKYILKKGNIKIVEKMNNFQFYISPSSFFQINTIQAIKLYNQIKKYADLKGNEVVLDLYCGTGTIGIYLSKYAKKVYGIEINEEAIKDATYNKSINSINNIKFYAMNANQFLTKIKEKIDIVVVDPPRTGLDKKTLVSILKLKATKIIYVSCNVATLARDLNNLKYDYNILEITPVDMFPRTCHCESITVLERR